MSPVSSAALPWVYFCFPLGFMKYGNYGTPISTFRTSRCLGTPSLESHRCPKWVWRWKLLLGGRNSQCRRIFKSKKKKIPIGYVREKVKVMFSKWEQQPKSIHKVEVGGTQEVCPGMTVLLSWVFPAGLPNSVRFGKSLLNIQGKRGHGSWVDICGKSKIKWAADTFSLTNIFFP